MKILVTGGAGYKGIKLCQALLEEGHSVKILDNFMYGQESCLYLFHYPKASFQRKDIRNLEPSDLQEFDVVFHLAGISGYPACEANPHSAQMINVDATRRLISLLSPQQYLIYASTTSIYGTSTGTSDESSAVNPISLYARTKYEAEKICSDRENTISLRFATIFGVAPRMRWDLLVNDFTLKAVKERSIVLFDSESIRTFLHIDDAIQSYLLALNSFETMKNDIYNVGHDTLNFSKMQIAHEIRKQISFEIIDSSLVDPDKRNFIIAFDKIKPFGFSPRVTLEKGIEELIRLYRFYEPVLPYRII